MTPIPRPTPDAHEWVSFEHDGRTWLFDVTFLTSNWRCIWDEGCPGIRDEPAPDALEGCCSLGAHLSDPEDLDRTRQAAGHLTPEQWQHHCDLDQAFGEDDGVWSTTLADDACVFLNRPGFEGGPGCALHLGAVEAGESVLDWKPEACWQLPLRLEHHIDDNGHAVATLREWKRHDWGDGGEDFSWWCTEHHQAFVDHTPVYERLREEIEALVGSELTQCLTDHLRARPTETLLPHPASRPMA